MALGALGTTNKFMNWLLRPFPEIPEELKSIPLSPITLRLLLQRGFFSREEIEKFLNAKYEDLYPPELLSGVDETVERIKKAKKNNEKIVIFGDYDADGITSALLLKETFEKISLKAETYIPDRNKEGYGLNKPALDFIKREYKPTLLFTVDCGISNKEEIAYAQKIGLEVIVTDHHSIPKKLPENCIQINPKLPNQKYPFKDLAGVGVVFKLCQAIWKEFLPEKQEQLKWLLDLVAIGTIADCVPLVDENRIFAKFGLIVLQKTKRLGIQEMIKVARLNINEKNPPSVENIAFQIGPRFNAAGRIDHADITMKLLGEKDPVSARVLALELEGKNNERQKATQEVYEEVKKTLSSEEEQKLIIRVGQHWPIGVLGVVAGKIAEEYNCPTFILCQGEGLVEGSGRSIEKFDLIGAVSQIDKYVEKYGGHSQAMGVKIKFENLSAFEKGLLEIIEKNYDKDTWGKKIIIDAEIKAEEIGWDIISEVKRFEPFGEGNEEPIFLTRNLVVKETRLVGNGQRHLKVVLLPEGNDNQCFNGIFFGAGGKISQLRLGSRISVVYNLRSNEWNGNHRIEMNIIDLKEN